MNTQTMTIDPGEVVIDLPVDEANVKQKMDSIRQFGLYPGVTIRLQDMRIIDGFHRVVAANRLGIKQITVEVFDLDDEAFWTLRIQSARQHHKIEGDRLKAWINECWKASKWYVPLEPDDKGLMPRAYQTNVDLTLIEAVWTVWRKLSLDPSTVGCIRVDTKTQFEIQDWVIERAKQWGISSSDLVSTILMEVGIGLRGPAMDETYDAWARKHNLNLKQRLRLQREIPREPGKYSQPGWDIADDYVTEVIAKDAEVDGGYYEYAERKYQAELEKEREENIKAQQEQKRREADPAYQKREASKRRQESTKMATEMLSEMRNWIGGIEQHLTASERGRELLASFISFLVETYNRLYPDAESPEALSAVAQENMRLQDELKDAQRKIRSLQRAVKLKKGTRLTNEQLAVSSTEIEAMSN